MSIASTLLKKIATLGPGTTFCGNDFRDFGSCGAIDVTLHRLAKTGLIRRLGFGLYDKPRKSSILGDLNPDITQIINAYARRTGQTIIMDPHGAANALSLTTQVPAKMSFLTNGKSHVLHICNIDIKLIHASPKKLVGADTPIGIIIQALRYFGTDDIPAKVIKTLIKHLSPKDIRDLTAVRNKTLRQIAPQIDRIISHANI